MLDSPFKTFAAKRVGPRGATVHLPELVGFGDTNTLVSGMCGDFGCPWDNNGWAVSGQELEIFAPLALPPCSASSPHPCAGRRPPHLGPMHTSGPH